MINSEFPTDCKANQVDWTDVVEPITKAELDNWIKTLEDKKYTLGRGSLKVKQENGICHCVLGMYAEEKGELVTQHEDSSYWSFIKTDSSKYPYGSSSALVIFEEGAKPKDYHIPEDIQGDIFACNDDPDSTYETIANYLKETFGIKNAE